MPTRESSGVQPRVHLPARWLNWVILITLGAIWGASYLFIKVGASQITPLTFVAGRVTIAAFTVAVMLLVSGKPKQSSAASTNQGPSSKVGGAEITPVTFVAGRIGVAAITVAVMLLARRERFPQWRRELWWPLVVMGFTNGVIPYVLITWGETQISSGLAGILVATMPIFTVLFAHWFTHDEKLNTNKVVGVAVGFLGVVILFLPDIQHGMSLTLFGALVTVVAAVSYGFATVFAHKYVKGVSTLGAEFGQMVSGAVVLIPSSLVLEHPWTLHPSPFAIGSLVILAVVNTAFAYLLYYWLIDHMGATSTSLVTYISPVVSLLLGTLVLHEVFDWTAIVGFLGIIAGVGLVTRTPAARVPVPRGAEAE